LSSSMMTSCVTSNGNAKKSSTKAPRKRAKKNLSEKKMDDATTKNVNEAFTPSVLNNQITAMRRLVKSAKQKLIQKMNHQIKKMQIITEKNQSEKMKKQMEKLKQDIVAMQIIDKDDVSKFALVNKDSLEKLLNKPNLSSSERALSNWRRLLLLMQM
ncbi:hypothetical protein PMAYCL1PPCAC_23680, partial [Pristionchus mayeri]